MKFNPKDIIFDPNIFAIATGISEHNKYGEAYILCNGDQTKNAINPCQWWKLVISLSLLGNNTVREAMHSVFYIIQLNMVWIWVL